MTTTYLVIGLTVQGVAIVGLLALGVYMRRRANRAFKIVEDNLNSLHRDSHRHGGGIRDVQWTIEHYHGSRIRNLEGDHRIAKARLLATEEAIKRLQELPILRREHLVDDALREVGEPGLSIEAAKRLREGD